MSDFDLEVSAWEVDLIHVNAESERSGDAIACRYFLSDGSQRVVVVDGGTKESGARLVEFIKTRYGTTIVDHVVNTHPDQDHASGLSVVLEELEVRRLWMHRPWAHAADVRELFENDNITTSTLAAKIKEGLSAAWNLEQIANERGIPIEEPFQGSLIGRFIVLAPGLARYQALIPLFSGTPAAKAEANVLTKALSWVKETVYGVAEDHNIETLSSRAETSPTNESSTCLLGVFGDGKGKALLTADCGVQALTEAADFATVSLQLSLTSDLRFVQVPHHGSRNNVTPEVLDRILGPRLPNEGGRSGSACVSAGGASETHPRRVVTNAFRRRGYPVCYAKKESFWTHTNMQPRAGYFDATPLPHYPTVESG